MELGGSSCPPVSPNWNHNWSHWPVLSLCNRSSPGNRKREPKMTSFSLVWMEAGEPAVSVQKRPHEDFHAPNIRLLESGVSGSLSLRFNQTRFSDPPQATNHGLAALSPPTLLKPFCWICAARCDFPCLVFIVIVFWPVCLSPDATGGSWLKVESEHPQRNFKTGLVLSQRLHPLAPSSGSISWFSLQV